MLHRWGYMLKVEFCSLCTCYCMQIWWSFDRQRTLDDGYDTFQTSVFISIGKTILHSLVAFLLWDSSYCYKEVLFQAIWFLWSYHWFHSFFFRRTSKWRTTALHVNAVIGSWMSSTHDHLCFDCFTSLNYCYSWLMSSTHEPCKLYHDTQKAISWDFELYTAQN